ncbi:hypothetical protein [Solibacillus sp. FSL H8-0538]|uniref:hypothetical protein n=1 Tax=Solibacillus sp. FSL H8-0538 TaxID=2921400 RepID=UPI0030FA18F5
MRTGDLSKKYDIEEATIRNYARDIRNVVPEFAPKDSIGAFYKGNDKIQMEWLLSEIKSGKKPRDVIPIVIKRLKQGETPHVDKGCSLIIPATTIQKSNNEQRIVIEVIVKLA